MNERVAVIGAGTMGRGIAQVAAQAGFPVTLYDVFPEALPQALEHLQAILNKLEAKGRLQEPAHAILERIQTTTALEDLKEARWVIEAAPERLELKRELFARLDELAPHAILASNTSTLSITAIASATKRPHQVVGLHFFNPAPLMKLVEVIPGLETAPEVVEAAVAFAQRLGKEPVVAKDSPGFIVNRVARPFYGEALKLHGEGLPFEAIDAIMRGLGFRMGPFELMDLIGLDVNYAATTSVYEAYFQEPRYKPHPIQRRMVEAGYLGQKSGRGFYQYPRTPQEADPPPPHPEQAPKALILGSGPLADLLRARFAHTTNSDEAAFILDARVRLEKKSYPAAPPKLPVVTLVWGHSASTALRAYSEASDVAGFSLVPPVTERAVAELYTPLAGGEEAVGLARRYFEAHGLRTLTLPDTPGGVGFRILALLINEAVSALQEGIADPQGIDRAMRLGTNYPLGPLEWSEALGIKEVLRGLEGLFHELGEDRYRPQPLLRRAAAAGLGKWR